MLIDYIRQVHANQKFKLGDTFEFVEFDDVSGELISDEDPIPDTVEIWAAVKVPYEGELPESYKILNLTIGDWVAQKEAELTKIIHAKLAEHLQATYPESDSSAIKESEDSAIWLDQLDYMPRVNEGEKTMVIEIDLVLDAESIED